MNFRNGDRCTGKHVFGPVLAVAGRNRETAAFLCGTLAEKPALIFLASATRLARRAAPSKTTAFLIIIYLQNMELTMLTTAQRSKAQYNAGLSLQQRNTSAQTTTQTTKQAATQDSIRTTQQGAAQIPV